MGTCWKLTLADMLLNVLKKPYSYDLYDKGNEYVL